MILPCSENATQFLIGSLWDTHQHCLTISYQNVPSSWAVVCLRFIWERVGISLWQGRKWMQTETTSSFPCGNCHRSRYKIGRFAKDYLQHSGPGPSRSFKELIHMKKNIDLLYPPCLFLSLLVPKTVSFFGYIRPNISPIFFFHPTDRSWDESIKANPTTLAGRQPLRQTSYTIEEACVLL